MKYTMSFLIAILFSFCSVFAQKTDGKEKKPEMTFVKTEHNYGTIEHMGDGVCKFEFKNTGKIPLALSNVKTSCGCTTPKWPKEPIPKKKTGVIEVKYDTKRIGKFQKSITVYSNAKNSPIVLTIKGEVVKNTK